MGRIYADIREIWFDIMGDDPLSMCMLNTQMGRVRLSENNLTIDKIEKLMDVLEKVASNFHPSDEIKGRFKGCRQMLHKTTAHQGGKISASGPDDVDQARSFSLKLARNLGMQRSELTRIGTIIFDLGKAMLAHTAQIEFSIAPVEDLKRGMRITAAASDIPVEPELVLSQRDESDLGQALIAIKNKSDRFIFKKEEDECTVSVFIYLDKTGE